MATDASGDVMKALQESDAQLSEDQIANLLKSAHDAEAVGEALRYWEKEGEATKDVDGRWWLTH
jgi:hypothetical protein